MNLDYQSQGKTSPYKYRPPMNNMQNNYPSSAHYDDMMAARSYEAAAMQRAAAGMGSYGFVSHLPVQDRFIPVPQSAVPLKKRATAVYMASCPSLPPHLPSQPPVRSMSQEIASRKRVHSENSSELVESAQSQKRARTATDTSGNVSTESAASSSTPSASPEKNRNTTPAKIPPSTVGLSTYAADDVLSGRGGGTNSHPGNRFFRNLINIHRGKYLRAKKNDKPHISRSIVNTIRAKNGRFLKKEEEDGLWYEIGDDLAREKTSQALRQKAPEHRRIMEEQDQRARERFAVMPHAQTLPIDPSMPMIDRRALAASDMMDIPLPVPPLHDPMHPHGPQQNDDLMIHYMNLRRRQARLQREIALVNEIKQMKEQMLMY